MPAESSSDRRWILKTWYPARTSDKIALVAESLETHPGETGYIERAVPKAWYEHKSLGAAVTNLSTGPVRASARRTRVPNHSQYGRREGDIRRVQMAWVLLRRRGEILPAISFHVLSELRHLTKLFHLHIWAKRSGTAKLDSQDHARSAQSRLNLIRENHRHSAEFVKEVKEYFAAAQWRELSTRKQMCEDAMKDIAHFYKLRPLIADLEDAQQAHAQQYFALINANNSLASVAAEHLIKLLSPDSTQLDDLSKLANTFEEVRRDTIRGGAATPHV
jgi:hypothetical protein